MKTIISIFLALILTLSVSCFAQDNGAPEQDNFKHSSRVKEHALKIQHGESRTHKEHIKNTEEIGKHLDSVVTGYENLKKKIPKRFRDDVMKHTVSAEKQHAEAKKHHEALQHELSKDKHNEMAVRYHATKIYASVEKADKEKEFIKAKAEKPKN